MSKGKTRELLNNTAIFGIGTIGAKAISYVLVPLYTIYLTTSEYSVSDTITSTVTMIIPLLTMGFNHAILRFVLGKAENEKTAVQFSIIISFLGTTILCALLPLLNQITAYNGFAYYIPFLFLFSALQTNFSHYCKAIEKNKIFASGGIVSALLLSGLSILLVAFLKMGIKGFLMANLITHFISSAYYFFTCKLWRFLGRVDIDKETVSDMLRYSLPLMPNDLFWWIIQMSDRYLVIYICGSAVNGIYAMAYKIPSIFNLVVSIFISAFSITAIKECEEQLTESGKMDGTYFSEVYSQYHMITFTTVTIVILLSKPLTVLLLKNDFFNAWRYIPLLLCAYAVGNLQAFYGSILSGIKHTKICTLSTLAAAITNIILNLILIPRYSAYGAAIATIISYIVVLVIRIVGTAKYVSMNHFPIKTAQSIIAVLAMSFCYIKGSTMTTIVSIIFAVFIFITYKCEIVSFSKKAKELTISKMKCLIK